jgi:hypothetical protein
MSGIAAFLNRYAYLSPLFGFVTATAIFVLGPLLEAAGQVETPVPLAPVVESVTLASAVAPSMPPEWERPQVPEAIPPELTAHERYRVVRLLGAGGMGTVYEAEHLVMQRPVALKVIKRALTAKADALERFRREVRAAARLSHPNIVATTDAEDAGETQPTRGKLRVSTPRPTFRLTLTNGIT